ncbi:dTDP-4-dehydrorhamnose 3,5-epimerase [Desulfotruncus alcoholivorax]|uniref:dTDP-4-dehydrorhamnose 3,5-epimerase n=1 Tax=Desulfotruncus alcoholivorax TaxID=265477 RepID=UPI00041553F9|nr:dTDP-4-dehydrorhamnose 3,5-epimerase [Desulfotruncus alcoholivorax]
MKVTETNLSGVLMIEPDVYEDSRGYFLETWNSARYKEYGLPDKFVQDNLSFSRRGVLRGLHYQLPPKAQGKLVSVAVGEVFDVAVDIRRNSSTFGKWFGTVLSAENKKQLWIPEGFAHGFLVLSESAVFLYKVTEYYSPVYERCIRWDDPHIGIRWPIDATPVLSPKDLAGPSLAHAGVFE